METLSCYCKKCKADGYIEIPDFESPYCYYVICENCGWETAQVACSNCQIGGQLFDNVEEHPAKFKCNNCGALNDLPKDFYKKPTILHIYKVSSIFSILEKILEKTFLFLALLGVLSLLFLFLFVIIIPFFMWDKNAPLHMIYFPSLFFFALALWGVSIFMKLAGYPKRNSNVFQEIVSFVRKLLIIILAVLFFLGMIYISYMLGLLLFTKSISFSTLSAFLFFFICIGLFTLAINYIREKK